MDLQYNDDDDVVDEIEYCPTYTDQELKEDGYIHVPSVGNMSLPNML